LKVFLDSSVILSACGSDRSLSLLVAEIAPERGWQLTSSAYCRAETTRSIGRFAAGAGLYWDKLREQIVWVPNALTTSSPQILTAAKNRPVIMSALASGCVVLLTLDTRDFQLLLGTEVYGMLVTTPRQFLVREAIG
jgi:hypothetical protein